jgi:hypothetical protein
VSTGLEQRLRQELRLQADRVGAEDLRPLRQPRAASRGSAQWLGPVAAMVAIAVVTGGLMVTRNALHSYASPTELVRTAPPEPSLLAVAGSSLSGSANVIKLISVRDGKVVRQFPQPVAYGGSGLAFSPDSASVFLATQEVRISAISAGSGKSVSLARGLYPAVSPDSKYLAYATGSAMTRVAIRNLASGRTRSIDLAGQLGAGASLQSLGSTITWLGDGTQLIAVPAPDAARLSLSPGGGARAGPVNACGQQNSSRGLCVVVVDIGRTLSAHQVFIRGTSAQDDYLLLGGDLTASRAFFIAQAQASPDVVARVTIGRGTAVARPVLRVPQHGVALAMAPDGDQVIYQPRSSRSTLWAGTVRHGRVTRPHLLLVGTRRFAFYQVAW